MRIAIISSDEDASPKILRQSLGYMLRKEGVEVVEIPSTGFLHRLFPLYGPQKKPGAFHFQLRRKFQYYLADAAILKQLGNIDAIVFSVQSPNGFWRHEFAIETLRELTDVPIVYHEVYYLGNTPGQLARLVQKNDFSVERYDWHLAVSPITGIWSRQEPPWSVVGINLECASLHVPENKKMQAIVDFAQPGFERERERVLEALSNVGFEYFELTNRISMEEIRKLYRESAIFFLSFPEAFGVPIAECLSCGTPVFVPDASWAMSWRLKEGTLESSGNELPEDCFWIYRDREDLERQLTQFRSLPKHYASDVRSRFLKHYPFFYFGNQKGVREFLQRVEHRNFT